MKFNVASLLKEHTGATREHDVDEETPVEGQRHAVRGHVRFDRTPAGVLVRAELHSTGGGDCARCLRPVTFPVDVTFEEEFIPTVDVGTGARVAPPEGAEDAYRIDARHMLDLSEAVRQYWTMAAPMAPLCQEGCAGICPECGREVVGGHRCGGTEADPRWAGLKDVRPR